MNIWLCACEWVRAMLFLSFWHWFVWIEIEMDVMRYGAGEGGSVWEESSASQRPHSLHGSSTTQIRHRVPQIRFPRMCWCVDAEYADIMQRDIWTGEEHRTWRGSWLWWHFNVCCWWSGWCLIEFNCETMGEYQFFTNETGEMINWILIFGCARANPLDDGPSFNGKWRLIHARRSCGALMHERHERWQFCLCFGRLAALLWPSRCLSIEFSPFVYTFLHNSTT